MIQKIYTFTTLLGDAIIPKKYRKDVLTYLNKANVKEIPYFAYGISFYVGVIISLILDIIFFSTRVFTNFPFFIKLLLSIVVIPAIFIFIYFVSIFIYRIYLDAKIYHKVRKMEKVFPEFLSVLSLNLRSGQSLEQALENSTQKEFEYLTDEINLVTKRIKLGTDADASVREFTNSYKSEIIEETFDLILISWKKGASTPRLVDRIVENLNTQRFLREKIVAGVTSYKIFLTLLAFAIAPAMFALSYHLIKLIREISDQLIGVSNNAVLPIAINAVRINDPHFITFSALVVIAIAICVGVINSIVKTGSIRDSYKQILFYALFSFISYRIFMILFENFFTLFAV